VPKVVIKRVFFIFLAEPNLMLARSNLIEPSSHSLQLSLPLYQFLRAESKSFGQHLFKSVKSVHILYLSFFFLSITIFSHQVGY
jgi:hypothetical protein